MNKIAGDLWGTIAPPPGAATYGSYNDSAGGPGLFLSLILQTLIFGAGIFALFNFVIAGYSFLSAGGDPQKVANAWSKIYWSIIGLAVAAGSLVITALVSSILFDDSTYLLQLRIFTPTP